MEQMAKPYNEAQISILLMIQWNLDRSEYIFFREIIDLFQPRILKGI
jgi:hypothetical protein